MKKLFRHVLCLVAASWLAGAAQGREKIHVVYHADAPAVEQEAARTLAEYLDRIYSQQHFTATASTAAGRAPAIWVGSYGQLEGNMHPAVTIPKPGKNGFVILTPDGGAPNILKTIVGDTPKATLDGVYSLLEKLGYGFYLSYDAIPPVQKKADFTAWDMADQPLYGDRIIFNWHNFLSGCSGWSLPEWKTWVDQSAKMRTTAIMIHSYGNNPMVQFEMNGQLKPVGYLNTSDSGRDWGAQHVNDVRRLPGGWIFDEAVLGSTAARVSDDQRVEAVSSMMREVFDYARARGLDVIFAPDFDTQSANPPNNMESPQRNSTARHAFGTIASPAEISPTVLPNEITEHVLCFPHDTHERSNNQRTDAPRTLTFIPVSIFVQQFVTRFLKVYA